jgi:hypothetical protein
MQPIYKRKQVGQTGTLGQSLGPQRFALFRMLGRTGTHWDYVGQMKLWEEPRL